MNKESSNLFFGRYFIEFFSFEKKKPNSNNANKIVFVLVNSPYHTFLCISINEETVVGYFFIAKWEPFFTEVRNNAITKLQIVPKVALLLHTTEQ